MQFLLLAVMLTLPAFALKVDTVKSFNCYQYSDKQIRVPSNHFFNEQHRPDIEFSRSQKICSDLDYGLRDSSPFTPLMNEVDAFKLISLTEPQAFDLNNNGQPDIEDNFAATLIRDYNLNPGNFKSFGTFMNGTERVGYIINPMFGNVATCPRMNDFSPVAATVRKVYGLSAGTEPLYKAVRKPVYVLSQGRTVALPEDVIYVSESQITGAAFWINQGRTFLHDRNTIERGNGFGVSFFWPADKAAPFIKKANQQEYEIKNDVPFKRMVGCIPANS